jgi:hypothetical protein
VWKLRYDVLSALPSKCISSLTLLPRRFNETRKLLPRWFIGTRKLVRGFRVLQLKIINDLELKTSGNYFQPSNHGQRDIFSRISFPWEPIVRPNLRRTPRNKLRREAIFLKLSKSLELIRRTSEIRSAKACDVEKLPF